MRAIVYTRVSTQEQSDSGTSLQTQMDACLKLCNEKGYTVINQFSEAYSGLGMDRPKLNEMREIVRNNQVDIIACYALDRFSRDPVHFIVLQEELERNKVQLEFVTETTDSSDLGKLISYVKGYAAKLESTKIKERTLRGKAVRIANGRLVCGQGGKLYGYHYIAGKQVGEGIRVINQKESQTVQSMFDWFTTENLTLRGVGIRLRSLGIVSPTGKTEWSNPTIRCILRNKAYTGRTYANTRSHIEAKKQRNPQRKHKLTSTVFKPESEWIEVKDATPAIISDELFEKAQHRLERNQELCKRNTKREYLLSGFVYCQHCGRRFIGGTKPYGKGKEYRFYRCKPPSECHAKQWKAIDLEEQVWNEVHDILTNPDVVLKGLEALKSEAKELNKIQESTVKAESHLKELDKEQTQLLQWALKGFPEDTILKENERINADRARLLKHHAELQQRINSAQTADVDIEAIKQACTRIKKNLANLTFENKRFALEALKIKVLIDGSKATLHGCVSNLNGAIANNPCSGISSLRQAAE